MKLLGITLNREDLGLPQVNDTGSALTTGLQLVFAVIGAVTLLFIVLSALKLVVSQGDPQSVAKTRQSIIYAAIGLVIVISAELIVTFVLGEL